MPCKQFSLFSGFLFAVTILVSGQPLGHEFQVNETIAGNQEDPDVAADANGNFVVVWQSDRSDGTGRDVFGRVYDNAGNPLSGEIRINEVASGDHTRPAVASDANGNFIVVWESAGQDGDGLAVFGRGFDRFGTQLGGEFRVNTFTTGDQDDPDIAADPSGNFVVVWDGPGDTGSSRGIFARRYDASGAPLDSEEFVVNTFTAGSQTEPSIAVDTHGHFIVVWESDGQDLSGDGVFGQRYDAFGNPQGVEIPVNTTIDGDQANPAVASDAEGNFIVVWQSDDQDGNGRAVIGRRFDKFGNALGSEFQANTFTDGHQDNPGVGSDANGNFTVVWESLGQDLGGDGVFGQSYDPSGLPRGLEFQANQTTLLGQDTVAAAFASSTNGDLVVVWESREQDGSFNAVIGRRFLGAPGLVKRITNGPDVDGNQIADVAVLVAQPTSTTYAFDIVYTNPGGPDVVIRDTVPAEWQVLRVAGNFLVDGFSVPDSPDESGGTVTVFPANMKDNNRSATKIEWRPNPVNDRSTLTVVVESRGRPPRNLNKFAPASCGALSLNDGATAFELDPEGKSAGTLFSSNPLLLVAVEDLNGGGVFGDGSGDEDGDGRTDLEEVRDEPFTRPCNPDSDGDGLSDAEEIALGTDPNNGDTDADGVLDGEDLCPLDDGGGSVDANGCLLLVP